MFLNVFFISQQKKIKFVKKFLIAFQHVEANQHTRVDLSLKMKESDQSGYLVDSAPSSPIGLHTPILKNSRNVELADNNLDLMFCCMWYYSYFRVKPKGSHFYILCFKIVFVWATE